MIYITKSGVYKKIGDALLTIDGVHRKVVDAFITKSGVYRRIPIKRVEIPTIEQLFSVMVCDDIVGRNSSSSGSLNIELPTEYPFYIMGFCNDAMSVNKFTGPQQVELLTGNVKADQYGAITATGYTAKNSFGATIARVSFPGYSEEQIDGAIKSIIFRIRSGTNSSDKVSIRRIVTEPQIRADHIFIGAYNDALALWKDGSYIFLRDSTSAKSKRRGLIQDVEEDRWVFTPGLSSLGRDFYPASVYGWTLIAVT